MNPEIVFLNTISYPEAVKLQEKTRLSLSRGDPEEKIFILQHSPPVITLGRNRGAASVTADPEQIAAEGYEVIRSSRGGDVTVHEPGQAVIYYLLRTGSKRSGLFVAEKCAETARFIKEFCGLDIRFDQKSPGLWIGEKKLASVGFDLTGGISSHGIAVNVCNNLKGFSMIAPCGDPETAVTSIEIETGRPADLHEFCSGLKYFFEKIYR